VRIFSHGHASLRRLQENGVLQAALQTIEHVYDTTSDGKTRGTGAGLLLSVQNFKFIVCLYALEPNLGIVNTVSTYLQQKNIDLMQANALIVALQAELKAMRTEQKWSEIMQKAHALAGTLGIDTELKQERKKVPKRLDGRDVGVHLHPEDHLRIDLYTNVVDHISEQVTERFPDQLTDFAYLQPLNTQAIDGETENRWYDDWQNVISCTT
jgi:hypothetical protein